MNKKRINNYIPIAERAIIELKIADSNRKVSKNYRSHISSFGAAITLGSLKAATAFFLTQGDSDVERPVLLRAIYYIITDNHENLPKDKVTKILDFVCNTNDEIALREAFIDASIALKLALNAFDLGKKKDGERQ